ncbi:MAG: cytochrome c [Bacteroidales bacterium]|nr:cytochrome c [Bacteroidales bacterium]
MSTLLKGQKNNGFSKIVRLAFSLLIVASVVSFVSNVQQESAINPQVEASFVTDFNMMPAGDDVEAGKALFTSKACFACHGMNGEGNAIGPNLADDFSKNGCSEEEVATVIKTGVAGSTMVAYEAQLSSDEIKQLAAYIVSLKGSNPANAKAAEGDKCK